MQVTSGIQCNLLSPSYSTIYAPQGDAQSRFVLIQLLEGATPWEVPAGASVIVRAAKPDGTICMYDTNEAGESAYSVSGSTVTIELVGQVLTAPGPVLMQVDFYNAAGSHLSTFTFCCQVSESVVSDDDIVSSDYFSVLTATLTEMLQIEQAVRAAYGAPLVAATAAAMTDHTRIYVYTGSEAGYINGNWYYWDGSAWASGGVYNSSAVNVDSVPTQGSTNPVSSGGTYTAIAAETAARTAADTALSNGVDDVKSAAIQGLGQNLRSDTGAAICGNDLNNLPRNTVYGFVPYTGLANAPYTETGNGYGGLILTLSKQQPVNATMTQMIFRRDGRIYTRQYWGDAYGDWREFKTTAEIEAAIAEINSAITIATGYEAISLVPNTQVITGTSTGVVKQMVQEPSNDTDSLIADCSPGDVFLITAQGWTSYRTYAFIDSSSTILSMSGNGEALTNRQVVAPTNAAKIVVNAKRSVSPRYVFRLASWLVNKAEFAPTGQNIIDSTVTSICSGDANNLPNNNIYGILIAYDAISNMPFEPRGVNGTYQGTLYTLGKQKARGYGDIQYYVSRADDCGSYVRTYTNGWGSWKPVNEKTWKNVLGIGDSICEGWRNGNRGFAGMLGVPYRNLGVTGATLGSASGHTQIYTEIENETITEDLVIAEGGINDYYFDVPLGTLPTNPVINDTDAAALDKTTVSGGLEYLLYLIIKKAPFAQRYFLITHKTRNFPYTPCAAGYTQQDMHDRIVAICKLYNVKVIDVYEESVINSEFEVYKSPTAYSNTNQGVTKQYYVDKDGIHPMWLGYQAGYLPVMLRELQRANMT